MRAGRDALPPSMRGEHPSAELGNPAGNQPQAGSSAYYDYYAGRYAERSGTGEVAVIPIMGSLARYGYCSWGYEDLTGLLQSADSLSSIKAVVLEMNTPGGGVDGLRALADTVRTMSKPVVVWTPFCASAGYYIASQADEIIIEDQAVTSVGSIGVLMVYVDQSQALEKAGIQVTIFRSQGSDKKALINGIEPLSPETVSSVYQTLNEAKREFHGYVKRGRSGKLTSDEWTSADMYGVKAALSMGLADAKGSLSFAVSRALQLSKSI